MTRDEIVAFLESRLEAWRDRDSEVLAAGHAPDGIVISPMFTTIKGREAIAASYDALFRAFPDWDHTLEPPCVDGVRVAQLFHSRATHRGDFMGLPGTGKRFEIQGVHLFEMRDGLIAVDRRVYDFTGLLIQLGVLRGRVGR